jgi:hypothetical protein
MKRYTRSISPVLALLAALAWKPLPAAAQHSTPAWVNQEPIIIVGNWDSMPIFRRRVGGAPTDQEQIYQREHTEETVRKLKDLGVTMVITHFFKGFGLEAEKDHIADARRLVALCKKYGIRTGVYVGSTIAYETFLLENPEAAEWFAPDYLGHPVFYGEQTFRKRVYFMHPGYRDYVKKVIRLAIEDLKVDNIDFDNTSMQAQPPIFLHPLAVRQFREFLREKYPPAALQKRLGFSDVAYVEPPRYDRPLRVINDPLFQEWADFRCRQLAAYYEEMVKFIHSLDPNVAISTNPHSGISGRNTVWDQGVDYVRLLANTDIVWTEEGNEARVTPDGILVSKIRTYKMAGALKNKVLTYTGGMRGGKLQMAEAMAFDGHSLGMVGGALAGYDFPRDQRNYIQFFRQNFAKHYRNARHAADVAVLHSFATMGFNNDRPQQSVMLFEQALIQSRIPFHIIFDDDLKDLAAYRVLVLADQECLDDEKLSRIRAFVERGGGLVATEDTGLYTEWRLRRERSGLADLFDGLGRRQAGRGRVAYFPEVKPAVEKPPAEPMLSKYWRLPLNAQALVDAVKWASGGRMLLDVKAPAAVAAEVTEQKRAGEWLVHLLNYDDAKTPQVAGIGVSLELPPGKTVKRVSVLSPDETETRNVAFEVDGGRARFRFPVLHTYSVAVVEVN